MATGWRCGGIEQASQLPVAKGSTTLPRRGARGFGHARSLRRGGCLAWTQRARSATPGFVLPLEAGQRRRASSTRPPSQRRNRAPAVARLSMRRQDQVADPGTRVRRRSDFVRSSIGGALAGESSRFTATRPSACGCSTHDPSRAVPRSHPVVLRPRRGCLRPRHTDPGQGHQPDHSARLRRRVPRPTSTSPALSCRSPG
jgi:hypothetical protein